MGRIGMSELVVILLIVLVLFGGKKLPELMKALGQGIKEFKKASEPDPVETKAKGDDVPQNRA